MDSPRDKEKWDKARHDYEEEERYKMLKQKFELGQEVRVELIGTILSTQLYEGQISYNIKEYPNIIISAEGMRIKESCISELETPND